MKIARALSLAVAGVIAVWTFAAQAWYPYYGGTQASTVGQSYAMGMADLVRAAGDNNLRNSEAAINFESARSQQLDNRLKGTQTYIEMRNMNEAFRASQRTRGLSTEEAWRFAQMNMPKRLTSYDLDPVTGKISWPIPFMNPMFDDYTQQLDDLFASREVAHGSAGYESYVQIQTVTDKLLADLKARIRDFSANDYIQMKNFVESLAYEASLPAA